FPPYISRPVINHLENRAQNGHSRDCVLYENRPGAPSFASVVCFLRLVNNPSSGHSVERPTNRTQREGVGAMSLHEIFTVEGDPRELNCGQSKTKVSDQRILNRGIAEIVTGVRRQQC